MKSVGKSVAKIDSLALVTGKPVYTDDLAFQNALVIKILRSPHAFARINSIDTLKAANLEGVECILTYKDVPKTRFTSAGQSFPEPSPYDRLILDEIVRYVGDYASSGTYVTGMAVVKAAEDLKNKIIKEASIIMNIPEDMLELSEDKIISENGEKCLILKDLAEKLTIGIHGKTLVGYGNYGSDVTPPPYMAGFAEIETDKETGKIDIINYVGVVDCGTVVNPNLAKIQAEGRIVQGIGLALYEEVKHDKSGRLQTNSFMQYKIPTRKDVGNIIVDFQESYEPTGPFGAKSIGEIVINTPAPAIAAAVHNAVGVNIRSLPITPEKVFMAMNTKGK